MLQIFQSPQRTQREVSPRSPVSEAGQSLARVREIQKFAKVLPHCSSPVRLNHLARCRPLQALGRTAAGPAETFQELYEKLSNMAVTNSNNQLPLPTNNYPKIPRKKKHKKSSSKRTATSTSTSTTTRLCSAPDIVVSQTRPQHGEKQLGKKDSASRNPLLNDELRNNHRAKTPFNFVSQTFQTFIRKYVLFILIL